MNAAWHIAMKDLRLLLRDRMAIFWVFGFPLLFALFLGAVLEAGLSGGGARLPVWVVPASEGAPVERVLAGLSASERVDATVGPREEALEAVRRGSAVALLLVQEGSPAVTMIIDPAREMEASFVHAALLRALSAEPGAGAPELVTLERLVVHAQVRRASDYVFAPAVLWGLIGCAACFAISLVAERTRGTLKRLATAPIQRGTILLGKALACALASMGVGLVLTVIAWALFGVQFENPLKFLLALFAAAICFAGITMLLSVLGRTEQSVAGAGWASLIVLSMFGGGMVPLSLMPAWMADVGRASPVRWGIVALEGALWRGFSYQELWQGCGVLLLTGACAFAVGSYFFSRSFE